MRKIIFLLHSVAIILSSCNSTDYPFPQAEVELTDGPQITIHRYGRALFELDTTDLKNGLESIQDKFRLFLDADLDDTTNINQLYNYVTDTQLISIYQKTMEVYPNLNGLEKEFSTAFTRHQHYFPTEEIPEIYTYISDLYFESPVVIHQSNMIIALDVYLGSDYPKYRHLGLPLYKIHCMTPGNLIVDMMKALYFERVFREINARTLLDRMIQGGKLLAYLDAVLPEIHDSLKICYTEEKLSWAEENERNIWAFMVENELLFNTDYQLQTKLIQDGPFTAGFGNKSPSRLGIFIGWQIVRSYLRSNPGIRLQEVLSEPDSQKILNGAGYRP